MKSASAMSSVPSVKAIVEPPRRKLNASALATLWCLMSAMVLVYPGQVESADGMIITKHMPQGEPPVISPPFDISGDPALVPTMTHEERAAVAFNGTHYMIVWEGNCDVTPFQPRDIYAARVDVSGTVLDGTGIAISTGDSPEGFPAIASDGNDYMVIWQDNRNGDPDIYGARVDASGTVLDVGGIPIATGSPGQTSPAVAFDGTNYLVVWVDDGEYSIHGARVDPSGTVLDPGGIVITAADDLQEEPDIAFGGASYLVVWTDQRNGSWDIYGARVDPSGAVLDPDGIAIRAAAGAQRGPALAFDGMNYMVVWEDYSGSPQDIHGARVAQTGAVLDPDGVVISDAPEEQWESDIAFDGTNFAVVWEDNRSGGRDIYGARVTPSALVLDPDGIAISSGVKAAIEPAVAFDGGNYMVAWAGDTGRWDIYGTRVDPTGTVLAPDWTVISTRENRQSEPAASFDGTNYMVVWQDGRNGPWDIYGARVDPTGAVLDPTGILVATAEVNLRDPKIAFDGANYMAVWEDNTFGIAGARISPSGVVLDPGGIVITAEPGKQRFPEVVFDGTNYMVVWQDQRGATWDIYGARVTPSGTVLDPGGIVISAEAGSQEFPALAFDGTNYMVVWEDSRGGYDRDIYGARVNPSGTVLDPNGKTIAADDKYLRTPRISFDGTNYMVVWERDPIATDIYGARVDPSGTVLDPDPILITDAAHGQFDHRVVFDGTDHVVVWRDDRSWLPDIYAARVDPSGTVLDPAGIVMPAPAGAQTDPTLASGNSSQMLVAYCSTLPHHKCELYRIQGILLNPLVLLQATVELEPDVLNLKSKGKYVTAYIELPEGYDPGNIDVATVMLNGVLPAQMSPTSVGDYDADGVPDRMVKFDRSEFISLVVGVDGSSLWPNEARADSPPANHGDEFEVTIAGELVSGELFSGTDVVRIVAPGPSSSGSAGLEVFPTPFKNTARISYELAVEGPVSVRVYDGAGRLVTTLVNSHKPAGRHAIDWDRKAEDGRRVRAGVYFIRLEHQENTLVEKVLVVQ